MIIPTILAAGPLIPLGAEIATKAVSAVSGGFADLLKGTLAAGSQSADVKPSTESRPDRVGLPAGLSDPTTTPIDTAKLRDRTENLISSFRGRLDRLLTAQGIDLPAGLQLQLDPFGAIRVVGGSAESQRIEQIISNDPQLSDLFRAVSANLGILAAADEAATLTEPFTTDLLSTMDRLPHLFPAGRSRVVDLADATARKQAG